MMAGFDQWFYRTDDGSEHGPHSSQQMLSWFNAGYFGMNLLLCRAVDPVYSTLGDLIQRFGRVPFGDVPQLQPSPLMRPVYAATPTLLAYPPNGDQHGFSGAPPTPTSATTHSFPAALANDMRVASPDARSSTSQSPFGSSFPPAPGSDGGDLGADIGRRLGAVVFEQQQRQANVQTKPPPPPPPPQRQKVAMRDASSATDVSRMANTPTQTNAPPKTVDRGINTEPFKVNVEEVAALLHRFGIELVPSS